MSARSTTSRRRSSRPASTTRPSCGRRRRGRRSTSRRSAPRPASASRPTSPTPTTIRRASPIAKCWCSAAARPASPRRLPPPKPACASSSPTSRRSSAARCVSRAALTIDGQDGFAWAQAAIAKLAAMDNVRLLPRTTAFGYYAQNFVGLTERVTDHLAAPGQRPAARAALAGSREEGRPRHRRDRAADGVCRQRPAGRHAGVGGAHLSQPLRRRGRQQCRRLYRQRQRLCGGDRPEEGRRRHRGDRRPPRQSARAADRRGACPRHRDQ